MCLGYVRLRCYEITIFSIWIILNCRQIKKSEKEYVSSINSPNSTHDINKWGNLGLTYFIKLSPFITNEYLVETKYNKKEHNYVDAFLPKATIYVHVHLGENLIRLCFRSHNYY